MADTKISALTDGSTANSTDRLPAARTSDGGATWSNVYVTPGYIKTATIGAGSVSIASGKTFTLSNTLTLAGTDSTTMTFPSTSATLARTDAGNTFTGAQTFSVGTVNGTGLDITQTWTGTGTYTGLKYNVGTDSGPANAASLLLDLQVGGGSAVNFRKNGTLTINGTLTTTLSGTQLDLGGGRLVLDTGTGIGFARNYQIGWNVTQFAAGYNTTLGIVQNVGTLLISTSNATTQLGDADAAAPVAQTFKVQSGTAGASALSCSISGTTLTVGGAVTGTIAIGHAVTGTNVSAGTVITAGSGVSWTVNNSQTVSSTTMYFNSVGADFTIRGSQGSGPSAGGSLIFQVAPAGSAATTAQNAYVTALSILNPASNNVMLRVSSNNAYIKSADANTFAIGDFNGGANSISYGIQVRPLSNDTGLKTSVGITIAGGAFGSNETFIYSDASNTLALRNGGTSSSPVPQKFNIYNYWASASNYECLSLFFNSNIATIFVDKAGSGSNRDLALQGYGSIRLIPGNVDVVSISSTTMSIFDGKNIAFDVTTGTKIGTATSQKIGFWNATPAVQPTAVADATNATDVITQLNALLSRMRTIGIIAT